MTSAERRVAAALQGLGLHADGDEVALLRKQPIHVHVEPGNRQDEHFIAARACVNVLTRTFLDVTLSGVQATTLLPSQHPRLPRALQPGEAPTLVLTFTDAALKDYGGARVLYVDNRGWTAYIGTSGPWIQPLGPKNLVAAYFAGCWAAADAFNHRFAQLLQRAETAGPENTFDVLRLEESVGPRHEPNLETTPVVLDDVALIGVGSIGQAFVEAVSYVPRLRGRLHLIDHEDTDETNESRYPLSFPHNRGQPKVQIARDHLRNLHPSLDLTCGVPAPSVFGANLHFTPHGIDGLAFQTKLSHRPFQPLPYEGVMRARCRPFKTAIVAVDSAAVRRDIQMGLHETIYNAWTLAEDGQVAYAIGRHRIDGPWGCVACLYHVRSAAEPTEIDFAQKITGWSREKVIERLMTNRDQPTTQAESEELGARRGLPREHWPGLAGKPLHEVIHQACGLASISHGDRNVVSPVAHITALAGTLLAAAAIRHELGLDKLEHIAIYDGLRLPNRLSKEERRKAADCLCSDADVARVYSDIWRTGVATRELNGEAGEAP